MNASDMVINEDDDKECLEQNKPTAERNQRVRDQTI